MATLRLISDSEQFEVHGPDATLGRDATGDVVIDDRSISRKHALLSLRNGAWWIRDQASANGVLLDGRRVIEAELRHGQTLLLGNVQLQVRLLDDDDEGRTLLVDARALRTAGPAPASRAGAPPDLRWLWLAVAGGIALVLTIGVVGALFVLQRFSATRPAGGTPEVGAAEAVATPSLAVAPAAPVTDSVETAAAVAEAGAIEDTGPSTPPEVTLAAQAPAKEVLSTPPLPPPSTLRQAPVTTTPARIVALTATPPPEPVAPSNDLAAVPTIPAEVVAEAVRAAARDVDARNYLAAVTSLLQLASRLDASGDARGAARLRVYAGVALVGQGQTDAARELFSEALGVLGRRVKVVSQDFSPQSRDVVILAAELLNATPMPGEGPG